MPSRETNEIETRVVVGDLRMETRGMTRVLRGHALVFNQLSENLGGFREQIAPEAVDRTFNERIDVRALIDHDSSKVMGRLTAGTLRIEKDARGLLFEIDPPATTFSHDIQQSVQRGDVRENSFAFRAIGEAERWWDWTTDPPTRTVYDMRIREISLVTFPAYPQTDVALRSLAEGRRGAPSLQMLANRLAQARARS